MFLRVKSQSTIVFNRLRRCAENYAVAKSSDMPTWESQLARSMLATHVNTSLVTIIVIQICAIISERIHAN